MNSNLYVTVQPTRRIAEKSKFFYCHNIRNFFRGTNGKFLKMLKTHRNLQKMALKINLSQQFGIFDVEIVENLSRFKLNPSLISTYELPFERLFCQGVTLP